MSLKIRFSILTVLLLIIASVVTYSLMERIVSSVIDNWGKRVVEIQVLNDSARILQPLEREISIARDMAENESIIDLARNPDDSEAEIYALEQMEYYRRNFQSQSYFVALRSNGAYYHNNKTDEYGGNELRYFLDPENEADIWFYRLMDEGLDFHLNINPDEELGITNLWIDILMHDVSPNGEDSILGVIGTGISLEEFLSKVVNVQQDGVRTLFVDRYGAIQLYRDPEMIDYASFVKPEHQKHTIDLLFTRPQDSRRIYEIMENLLDADDFQTIQTMNVEVEGEVHLAGIAYLPSIGWYEISILDIHQIMPVSQFIPAILIFVAVLLGVLIILNLFLRFEIFNPLSDLERATDRLGTDSHESLDLPQGQGEISRLIDSFAHMAEAIRNHTIDLERQVEARTAQLKEIVLTDPLTGLLNRRGMSERINDQVQRSARNGEMYGLIWIDVDLFKEINDNYGHAIGDTILKAVSAIFSESIRPYDYVARWGGDEFLILLSSAGNQELTQIIDRLLSRIRSWTSPGAPTVSISIGGTISDGSEPVDNVLHRADVALYKAKEKGRNRAEIAY